MTWTGIYTNDVEIIERLQGRLQFTSSAGGTGPIVPVIEDALLKDIGNEVESRVTSVLCALHYTTPLQLTNNDTINLLREVVSKQIIYQLFESAPTVRDTCSCKSEDEKLEDILEEYQNALSNLCNDIQDCKIKLPGETRDPDPCAALANQIKNAQAVGTAGKARHRASPAEDEDRLFSHHVYVNDLYRRDY